MAQVRITELPESLTLDDESVFPMVYNMVTQKITFKSLKQVMLYFTNVVYDEKTGKFTFTRSDGSASILSSTLNKAFKKAEIINSDIVFTDFSGETYTVDLMTEELTQKLKEINNKMETNKQNIQKNANDIAKNKTAIQKNASDIKAINDSKGEPNGFAELDSNGQVPASQLPGYVDDVVEGYLYNGKFYEDSSHTILIVGESGKIYVDLATEKTYRWSGSAYAVISETLALGETSSTAYRGDRGKEAYDHKYTIGNPHKTTANDIGLGDVDNTPDADKVVKEAKKTTGTLTIQRNGTTLKTFNGSSNQTANITVPTKTSELTNDSDFVKSTGTIDVAKKVGTSTIGGSTTPVYINEGTPTAIGYTISKSVPADAVFTDTTYSNATQSKAGLMSATDKTKLDGVSSDADKVEWQQNVSTGVNIANVTINGVKTEIYAPTSSQYKGDMEKSVYDVNNDGVVDEASKTTGQLIIQKNSVDVASFDGSLNKTANILVPTKVSELTNDTGFITSSGSITGNAATATKATQDSSSQQINTTYLKNVYVPGQTTTITKGNGTTSIVKGFTTTVNNATANTWVKLGTFDNSTQGNGGEIWLFGGQGQNNSTNQNMWAHLLIKKGYQGTNISTTNYVAASYEIFTPPSQASKYKDVKFKVFCTEIGKIDVWVYFPFNYSRAYYYPAGLYDSFTAINTWTTEEPLAGDENGVLQPIAGGIVATSSIGMSIDEAIKSLSISGKVITITKGDNTTSTITTQDTTYSNATTSTAGLMSSSDKTKLDGIASGATANTGTITGVSVNSTSIATSGVANIPLSNGTGTAGAIKTTSTVTSNSGYTACPVISGVPYYKDTNTTYSVATQTSNGLMSASDKTKLDNMSSSSGAPIGSYFPFAGTTIPEGYLLCDGAAVSRTTYANLFAVIGTLYGEGDGSTTFNLPDLSDRIPVGTGFINGNPGDVGGENKHTLTKAELPNYTLYNSSHSHPGVYSGVNTNAGIKEDTDARNKGQVILSTSSKNTATTTITVNSGGSGVAMNNMQAYVATNYIIKY